MKRVFPRWCGGLLLALLLVLEPACSDSEQSPAGMDAGTDGGAPIPPGGDGGTTLGDGGTSSRKPHVVFVVDRSATMIWPADTSDPDCRMADNSICGTQRVDNCINSICPTRLGTTKTLMEVFMASHATDARFSLAFFPATSGGSSAEEMCRASSQMRVSPPTGDEPGQLQASADAVLQAIRNVPPPAGSSPLTDTLKMVERETPLGSSAAMPGDKVVIITDGVPNCNANNVYDGSQPECRCTLSPGLCTGDYARRGCVDEQGAAAVLTALRERGVRTYVMLVGTDVLAGEGPSVFNALAEAGGTARDCPQGTNEECGASNTCNPSTRQCSRRFLLPSDLNRILAP